MTLEKKILSPLLPGFELATFDLESGSLSNKLSRRAYNSYTLQIFCLRFEQVRATLHLKKKAQAGKEWSNISQNPRKRGKRHHRAQIFPVTLTLIPNPKPGTETI